MNITIWSLLIWFFFISQLEIYIRFFSNDEVSYWRLFRSELLYYNGNDKFILKLNCKWINRDLSTCATGEIVGQFYQTFDPIAKSCRTVFRRYFARYDAKCVILIKPFSINLSLIWLSNYVNMHWWNNHNLEFKI